MAIPLSRLLRALRRTPPQGRVIALVAAAALVSGLRTARRPPEATAGSPAAATQPDVVGESDALARPVEDAVTDARAGDVTGYLEQFGGTLREQLDRQRADRGDTWIRDYLARSMERVKGIAVRVDRQEASGPEERRLPVEFVYRDRTETQAFTMRREAGRWSITRIDAARASPVLVPYGAPLEKEK